MNLNSNIIEFKKRKEKKRTNNFKLLLFIGVIVLILLMSFKSSLFNISIVEIEGINHYTEEEIYEIIGMGNKTNIFELMFRDNVKHMEYDAFISNIDIKYSLPNSISINVKERKIIGYVPYMGTYLCLDKDGLILEDTPYIEGSYPLIEGLQFDEFSVGQVLQTKDKESFVCMLQLVQAFEKYRILGEIQKVNLYDCNNIILETNTIKANFGNIDEFDKKVNILSQAISKIPTSKKGIIDLQDVDKPIVFKNYG